MEKLTYSFEGEYIELIKLLKVMDIAQSGGHAKFLVEQESVRVNGEVETRKRRKLKFGDTIEIFEKFTVLSPLK